MSFSEASLLKKIQEVNNTQQSIQTLSLWLIHHRKYSKPIVQTWLQELLAAPKCDRKITFIYLANDILQNSRKKGSEFMKEFLNALPQAIENTSKVADTKSRFTLERIFNIWKDRKIYPDETIKKLKTTLHSQPKCDGDSPEENKTTNGIVSNGKSRENPSQNTPKKEELKRKSSSEDSKPSDTFDSSSKLFKKSLKGEVLKELANSNSTIPAPEPLELISMLHELEKSASSDAVIREKIAELPAQVIDVNAVKQLKDKKVAAELLASVNEAAKLVDEYNSRLQQELATRKRTALLLSAYIKQKQEEHENDQKLINEWKQKLKQVKSVEHELQVHLKSLPDLSSIEEGATLTPLPSAGDLFSS